jgi:hypothetical protein
VLHHYGQKLEDSLGIPSYGKSGQTGAEAAGLRNRFALCLIKLSASPPTGAVSFP